MSVSRESLVAALRKRSRSVIAHVDGEALYLLEAAADAIDSLTEAQDAEDNARVARLMAMVTPLGYSSALALLDSETRMMAEAARAKGAAL